MLFEARIVWRRDILARSIHLGKTLKCKLFVYILQFSHIHASKPPVFRSRKACNGGRLR